MARTIKPPSPLQLDSQTPTIFLAGSIEMGKAIDWQARFEAAFADIPCVLFNPRRDAWDATWVQSIDAQPFRGQVEWELEALERANVIAMYIAPATQSPISLLELGLFARSGKLIVCCPDGFWRKGNVDIVCHRYGIATATDLDQLIDASKQAMLQPS